MDDNSDNKYIFCPNCGVRNEKSSNFCVNCGYSLNDSKETNENDHNAHHNNERLNINTKNIFNTVIDSTTTELNKWTGGKGAVKISFIHFFAQVFKRHSESDAEKIFIVGTNDTTPSLSEISNNDVQPWLFSRILFMTLLSGLLLVILNRINDKQDVAAAAIVIVISVPISALVLFFETNVFKNISFYRVIQMFLIGGILSLIITIIISKTIIPTVAHLHSHLAIFISVGLVEEGSKVLIAAYFINKYNAKSIFNGLLIGASIGTGFAAFENIQYLYTIDMSSHYALIRTMSSISDHTEWCAISTAGLVLAKGSHKFQFEDFLNKKFLRFFILAVMIHACWDWEIPILRDFEIIKDSGLSLSHVFLAIVTWIIVLTLIHAGIREVKMLQFGIKKSINSKYE